MRPGRVGAAVVAAVLAILLVYGIRSMDRTETRAVAPVAPHAEPGPAPVVVPRRSIPLPRPERLGGAPSAPVAVGGAEAVAQSDAGGAAAGPPVDPAALRQALQAALDGSVREEMAACLEDTAPPEGFEGVVRLELKLAGEGLLEASVTDLDGAPDGLIDCVADAVWSGGWPELEGEVAVTWPVAFEIEAEDLGDGAGTEP